MRVYEPLAVRVLSHNIRYATQSPFKGEERWAIRRPYLCNELRFNTVHCAESFICLQEVLHEQLADILSDLNSKENAWEYVGVGRDDGHQAGEYSPILYRPAVWELKMQKTVWLSKTPDRPSKSWDAACTRILTIASFQHRMTQKNVVAMNTHLDHQGSKSRLEAAKIILKEVRLFSDQESHPKSPSVFLAGDFNSEPDQEAYKEMTSKRSPMVDMQKMVPESQRYGDLNSFSGFDSKTTRRTRIDFIFINKEDVEGADAREPAKTSAEKSWVVDGYAVLPNRFEDGVYNSDHQAVIGDISII
ncbi:hypothetical protein P7C71_g3576, partial [Lecanoromycetidae sp. Uapishka_2]